MLNKEELDILENKYFTNKGNLRFSSNSIKIGDIPLIEVYNKVFDFVKSHETCSISGKDELCKEGKRRSFIDLYRLCKHYSACTLSEFIEVIRKVNPTSYYCPQINRCILKETNFKYTSHYLFYKGLDLCDRKYSEFGNRTLEEFIN